MTDDLDDLIGTPTPPKRRGRPPKALSAPKVTPRVADTARMLFPTPEEDAERRARPRLITSGGNEMADHGLSLDVGDVEAGVTVSWLAAVFHMGIPTIKRKLAHCPPMQKHKGGYIYDLKIAVQYLVPPKVDITTYIKSMRPGDLPPMLQKDYWDAMLKRQKWEEEAGELWRTEKVVEVLGEAFKRVKTSLQLWPENLERIHGLTTGQRETLVSALDGLLDELHKALVAMPSERETRSVKAEHDDMTVLPGGPAPEADDGL